MPLVTAIGAIVGGTILGGGLGYALGRRVIGNRRAFWGAIAVAMIVCIAVDLAGLAVGQRWVALGSLGLMAGALTGLKYGGVHGVRFWEPPPASRADEPGHGDAPAPEGVDVEE